MRNLNETCRRDVLKIGALTAFGLGATDLVRLRAEETASSAKARSCILLWLDGGPSHLETFDLKPDAPLEVRGPFQPIESNVPGIRVSEHLPLTARICDRLAVIRSMTSPLGEHGLANQYLLTGYQPTPVLQHPSFGSVVKKIRNNPSVLPDYIAIPESRLAGAGFLGKEHEPFTTGGDPSKEDFRVRDLNFFPGVNESRIQRRREYLNAFDAVQRQFESSSVSRDSAFEQAYRLVTSPEAKQAFELSSEPAAIRDRYGSRTFGQSCLLARRLVERRVPFVTVMNPGWDTHENLTLQLRDGFSGAKTGVGLIPTFDQGFSALVEDLTERGLIDETLVIAMGEFGRTPKLNARGGRDHWPRVFSVVLAGGGISGGQIIGESDRTGESPLNRPVTPNDLARTIYALLGISPDTILKTPDGRPVPVNQGGEVIRELAATIL